LIEKFAGCQHVDRKSFAAFEVGKVPGDDAGDPQEGLIAAVDREKQPKIYQAGATRPDKF
jgi:hypothetical protein